MSQGHAYRIREARRKLSSAADHHTSISGVRDALRELAELGADTRSEYETARRFKLWSEFRFSRADLALLDEILADPAWLAEMCAEFREGLVSKAQTKLLGSVFEEGIQRMVYSEPELRGASGWWPHEWWPDLPPWNVVRPGNVTVKHDPRADAVASLVHALRGYLPGESFVRIDDIKAALREVRESGLDPQAEYVQRLAQSVAGGSVQMVDEWPPEPGHNCPMPAFHLVSPD